jgi:hypothetical protein
MANLSDKTGFIGDASATESGIVNTIAQTFAGVKTFNDGIQPDNAADTLNDYQEDQTFTPSYTIQGGGTIGSPTIDVARYSIIGKDMFINFAIALGTVSGTVSSFGLTLPASKTMAITSGQINLPCFLTQSAVDFTIGRASVNSSFNTEIRFFKLNATNFSTGDSVDLQVHVPIQ